MGIIGSIKVGFIATMVKGAFNTIFYSLAKENGMDVNEVTLGIYYENGSHKYELRKGTEKIKDINLDDCFGAMIDLSGGTGAIDQVIGGAFPMYVAYLTKILNREVKAEEIQILMRKNPLTEENGKFIEGIDSYLEDAFNKLHTDNHKNEKYNHLNGKVYFPQEWVGDNLNPLEKWVTKDEYFAIRKSKYPEAFLLCGGERIRKINIEQEFL